MVNMHKLQLFLKIIVAISYVSMLFTVSGRLSTIILIAVGIALFLYLK